MLSLAKAVLVIRPKRYTISHKLRLTDLQLRERLRRVEGGLQDPSIPQVHPDGHAPICCRPPALLLIPQLLGLQRRRLVPDMRSGPGSIDAVVIICRKLVEGIWQLLGAVALATAIVT